MKGTVGTSTFMFILFHKKLSNKIKEIPNLPKEVKNRLKWLQHFNKTKNISKTCRYFGISRNTFYKWKKRYDKYGLDGLFNKPNTPINKRKPIIRNKYKDLVVKIRTKYPTWSKDKISAYIKEEFGIEISPSTVYRILKETKMIEKTKKTKGYRKQKYGKKRIRRGLRATSPGEVVQIDVKYIPRGDGYVYQP